MSTLSQLSYNGRYYKRVRKLPYSDTPRLFKNPQLKGVVRKLGIMTPKKPNSALRHILRVEIYKTKRNLIARIPGNDLWPVKFNRTLIEGGRANDLPIVRYTSIRGKFDVAGFFMRKKKRRSIYGARRPEGYTTHVRRKFRKLGYV